MTAQYYVLKLVRTESLPDLDKIGIGMFMVSQYIRPNIVFAKNGTNHQKSDKTTIYFLLLNTAKKMIPTYLLADSAVTQPPIPMYQLGLPNQEIE